MEPIIRELYAELNGLTIPSCKRKHVTDDPRARCVCLGYVLRYGNTARGSCAVAPSRHNRGFERALALMHRLFRQGLPADATYTSIALNHAYAARPHRDKYNVGPSHTISFGEFGGGELHVRTKDGERRYATRDRFLTFDGQNEHWVAPFTGDRYSLVYFTDGRFSQLADCARADGAIDWRGHLDAYARRHGLASVPMYHGCPSVPWELEVKPALDWYYRRHGHTAVQQTCVVPASVDDPHIRGYKLGYAVHNMKSKRLFLRDAYAITRVGWLADRHFLYSRKNLHVHVSEVTRRPCTVDTALREFVRLHRAIVESGVYRRCPYGNRTMTLYRARKRYEKDRASDQKP